MSEQTEKLVHIIMPDLLNYLEMVESGEIIEKRIEKNKLLTQKKKNIHIFHIDSRTLTLRIFYQKKFQNTRPQLLFYEHLALANEFYSTKNT